MGALVRFRSQLAKGRLPGWSWVVDAAVSDSGRWSLAVAANEAGVAGACLFMCSCTWDEFQQQRLRHHRPTTATASGLLGARGH